MNAWKKRGLSLVLTGSLLVSVSGISALAADGAKPTAKEETVFVVAGADGTAKEIIVSDWLQNGDGAASLQDVSDLQDIQVVKGDAEQSGSGDGLSWETAGEDVYYQGTSTKKLPVTVEFSYELDGKKITPEELAGKSGTLKLTISYRNNTKETVTVDGKQETMYVPFLMATGLVLDSENCKNVEVDHGMVETDGDRVIILGYGMPGLADSLKLEELQEKIKTDDGDDKKLEIPDSVEITAEVTDFELDMAVTVASCGLLDELELTGNETRQELEDALDELDDASEKLLDGTGELLDGVKELKDGTGELKDGAAELNDGAGQLLSGGEELDSGVGTLADGAKSLDEGAKSLNAGVAQIQSALDQLNGKSAVLTGGSAQVKAVLTQLQQQLNDISQYAGKVTLLVNGSAQIKSGIDTVTNVVGTLQQQVSYAGYVSAVKQASGGQVDVNAIQQRNTSTIALLKQQIQGLEAQIEVLRGQTQSSGATHQAPGTSGATGTSGTPNPSASAPAVTPAPDHAAAETPAPQQPVSEQPSSAPAQTEAEQAQPEVPEVQAEQETQPEAAAIPEEVNPLAASQREYRLDMLAAGVQDAAAAQIAQIQGQIQLLQQLVTLLEGNNATILGTQTYLSTVNQYLTVLLRGEDGNGGLQALQQGAAALDSGVQELAGTLSGLMSQTSRLTEFVTAYVQLDQGIQDYTGAVSQILDGQRKVAAGSSALAQGSGTLKSGTDTLKAGTGSLVSGITSLYDGTGALYDGTGELDDGVEKLLDGAEELHDGMEEFREEGIEKLVNLYRDNIPLLIHRLEALQELGQGYNSFAGVPEGTDGSVRFVIRTEN